jgi:hypothetical protein
MLNLFLAPLMWSNEPSDSAWGTYRQLLPRGDVSSGVGCRPEVAHSQSDAIYAYSTFDCQICDRL